MSKSQTERSLSGQNLQGSGGKVWQVKQLLGRGTCCEVYKATLLGEEATQVAIKIYKPGSSYAAAFKRECVILEMIQKEKERDSYPIRVLDQFSHAGQPCLVQELCEGHIWHIIAKNQDEGLSLHLIQRLARDMFRGLACLHKAGFVHGDVKPTNLMWSPNGGMLCVIDYGLSFHMEDKDVRHLQTPGYRAPEVEQWNKSVINPEDKPAAHLTVSEAIDIWSAGCVLAEMFLGRRLIDGSNKEAREQNQGEGTVCYTQLLVQRLLKPRDCREKEGTTLLKDLIHNCLHKEPSNRLTAQDALDHRFFKLHIDPSFVDMLLLPSPVLRLLNVLEDVDPSSAEDVQDTIDDILDGCQKYGPIVKHTVPWEGPGSAKLFVLYSHNAHAIAAYEALSRKTFNHRTVLLTYFPLDDFKKGNFY